MAFAEIRYRPNKHDSLISIFNLPLILKDCCLVYLDIRKLFFTPQPFYPRGKKPGTHWTGGWVSPRADMDIEMKSKI
jgi:hypothetical protein